MAELITVMSLAGIVAAVAFEAMVGPAKGRR